MHISLEAQEQNAIQSYNDTQIKINSIAYEKSLIVSREEIITDLTIISIKEFDEVYMQLLLESSPEIIIIGHKDLGQFPPMNWISMLSKKGIGVECMSIGAAARTYNVLLSELRAVTAGFIL